MQENEKLKNARKDRRWSIEKAAEKIGISRTTYLRWEHGDQDPHDSTVLLACEAFNMSPEQLGFNTPISAISANTVNKSTTTYAHTPAADIFKIATSALKVVQYQYGWTPEELRFKTEEEIRRLDNMEKQDGKPISRRHALGFIAGLPLAVLGLSEIDHITTLPTEEAIPLYVTGIPACWRLYFDGELAEVASVIPQYIAHLTSLVHQPSKYQETAAAVLSQAHQLGYLVELQDQNFKIAQAHAGEALQYAELAHDPNLQVASLIRQGNLFYALKRPIQTVQKYQEAVLHSRSASPLLQGQAHVGLAEALARISDTQETLRQEALRHHGLAHEIFPSSPEEDPNYAYTHFNNFTLTNFTGLMHIHLKQPTQAWEAFTQVDKEVPKALVPQRVELTNRQTAALLAIGDMHQTCDHFEIAVPAALALGSDLRYNEACETYEQAQIKWPHEQRVKDLAELFQR